MEAQDNRHEQIRRYVASVPHVEIDDEQSLLSYKEALVAWRDLHSNDSQIPERIKKLVAQLEGEVIPQLERFDRFEDDSVHYVITPIELHGIIARAAIRGSAQTVADIGSRLKEAAALSSLLDTPFDNDDPGQD